MNIYNPFKPHIVKNDNGTYSVRKLDLIRGWMKLDANADSFWIHSKNSGLFTEYYELTAHEAFLLFEKITTIKRKSSDKYVNINELKKQLKD